MTQAIPSACAASQVSRIESRSDGGSVDDGDAAAADGGRHVGVREHGPDDRLGLGHDLLRRPVVDAQGGQVDPVEPDPLEPFLPRLGEPVPGLGAVPDDGEAPGRAAQQQHLPLRVGQLLGLVHDDVRERAGEQVRVGARAARPRRPGRPAGPARAASTSRSISESSAAIRSSTTSAICSRSAATAASLPAPAPGRLRVAEPLPGRVQQRQVGHRPGLGVRALQRPDLVGARARERTCAGRRAPTTGRRRGRSPRAAATPG